MNTSSPAHVTAAAGSSSSRRSSWKYEVFLSFRGEDTRTRFTDHLIFALRDAGINTFIDYELRKGENIQRELDREIEGSRIAVIVFSKSYAESRWCLRELSKIMREGKVVYPIFYNVDPSQLREQSNSLREAFQDEDPNEVEQWRKDLKASADLVGRNLKATADRREGLFIKNVVGDIIALTKTSDLQTSQAREELQAFEEEDPDDPILIFFKSRSSTQDPEREGNLSPGDAHDFEYGIHSRGYDNRTPLYIASHQGCIDISGHVPIHGCDVSLRIVHANDRDFRLKFLYAVTVFENARARVAPCMGKSEQPTSKWSHSSSSKAKKETFWGFFAFENPTLGAQGSW